jgi:peptide deformylase
MTVHNLKSCKKKDDSGTNKNQYLKGYTYHICQQIFVFKLFINSQIKSFLIFYTIIMLVLEEVFMITMKDIIQDGHPTLKKVAGDVPMPPSKEDQHILKSLLEYIQNSQDPKIAEQYELRPGVGLAAPQINISKKMIAVQTKDDKGQLKSFALFNPKIFTHSMEKTYLNTGEGCLSVPEIIPGYVPRYSRIKVQGNDINGKEIMVCLKGLLAIVFQHEIDHLQGVMFYDHINKEDPFAVPEQASAVER